ncbi:MAG: Peptide/nickel transport system substrate-binding protein [Gemmatimonadetes bacterium]|nr:Peptide/nickel transport system substrate-binding protein [Gemmatimonadota bacterium]
MNARKGLVGAAAALCALLAACGGGEGGAGGAAAGGPVGQPVNGGTAIVAVKSDFDAFNPVTSTALTTLDIVKDMLFTPLIRYDEKLNPTPYLAERWELSDTAVVFHLRDGVTWHDGQPLTAEDVKFTFDLAKAKETASLLGSAYLTMVKSATVVDPHTIRFGFTAPHAQALDDFWWAPLPRHLLQNVAPSALAQAPFNRQPVGSGPFKLASWQAGQAVTLEANPAFPASMGGRPRLDRVVFRIIPEATTRMNELQAGTVDVNYSVQPDEAKQLQGQPAIHVFHYPSREFTYLGWNATRPLFADARVRRALTQAIDRNRLMAAPFMYGFAQAGSSVIPPISPMNPGLQPLPFDPAAAKALLAQAGWTDSNGDGVLDKGGQPFRFNLITSASNRLFSDVATVIQQQLKAVGVDAQIQTMEFQTLLRAHKSREYDGIITNWTWDYFRADPTPLFSCAEARKPSSANRTGYCNPQADALMQKGLAATDPAQAKAVWTEFAGLLQQDQPVTVLFWAEEIGGVGPRVQDVRMDARSKLANVTQWWIPAARQKR